MSDLSPAQEPRLPEQVPVAPPAAESAPPSMPPGWYPDATMPGMQRWWTGQGWGDQRQPMVQAPVNTTVVIQPKRVNHALHLILSICTLGLWLPVWAILAIANS